MARVKSKACPRHKPTAHEKDNDQFQALLSLVGACLMAMTQGISLDKILGIHLNCRGISLDKIYGIVPDCPRGLPGPRAVHSNRLSAFISIGHDP